MRAKPCIAWTLAVLLLSGLAGVRQARAQGGAYGGGYGGYATPPGPRVDPSRFIAGMEARRQARASAQTKARPTPARPGAPRATKEPTPPRTPIASADPRPNEEKAEQLVRLGKALEDRGQRPQALRYYREVVEKYAGTSQARRAADRIKALK